MFERRLDDLVPRSPSRGTIYLNPIHDKFIIGLDFAPQYARKSLTHSGGGKPLTERVPSRPVTESLSIETCQELERVVLAELDTQELGQTANAALEYKRKSAAPLEPARLQRVHHVPASLDGWPTADTGSESDLQRPLRPAPPP